MIRKSPDSGKEEAPRSKQSYRFYSSLARQTAFFRLARETTFTGSLSSIDLVIDKNLMPRIKIALWPRETRARLLSDYPNFIAQK